jgi:hypothetical protein
VACHDAGGEIHQIQFLIGHVPAQTTERYLDCIQRIQDTPSGFFTCRLGRLMTPFERFSEEVSGFRAEGRETGSGTTGRWPDYAKRANADLSISAPANTPRAMRNLTRMRKYKTSNA